MSEEILPAIGKKKKRTNKRCYIEDEIRKNKIPSSLLELAPQRQLKTDSEKARENLR